MLSNTLSGWQSTSVPSGYSSRNWSQVAHSGAGSQVKMCQCWSLVHQAGLARSHFKTLQHSLDRPIEMQALLRKHWTLEHLLSGIGESEVLVNQFIGFETNIDGDSKLSRWKVCGEVGGRWRGRWGLSDNCHMQRRRERLEDLQRSYNLWNKRMKYLQKSVNNV